MHFNCHRSKFVFCKSSPNINIFNIYETVNIFTGEKEKTDFRDIIYVNDEVVSTLHLDDEYNFKGITVFETGEYRELPLYESAYSSVVSVLVVGGLITIFYLLTQILYDFHLLDGIIWVFNLIFKDENLATGLSLGLFECTNGLKYLSKSKGQILSLPLCAFLCGFGGISIIMQSIAYLKKAKIKTTALVFSKLLSAVLNFIVGLILALCFLN